MTIDFVQWTHPSDQWIPQNERPTENKALDARRRIFESLEVVEQLLSAGLRISDAVDVIQVDRVRNRVKAIRESSELEVSPGDDIPISRDTEEQANRIAQELASESFPFPRIERGDFGSILFMWRTTRYIIDLELFDGDPTVCIYDRQNVEPYTVNTFSAEKSRLQRILSVRTGPLS